MHGCVFFLTVKNPNPGAVPGRKGLPPVMLVFAHGGSLRIRPLSCFLMGIPIKKRYYADDVYACFRRARQELPRVALTRPTDWARLVTSLDPLTVHVVTAQWETAGGAASMPEFYEAIFGGVGQRADGADGAAAADAVDGSGGGSSAGVGSVAGGDGVLGGMGEAAAEAAFAAVVGGDHVSLQSEHPQLHPVQQQQMEPVRQQQQLQSEQQLPSQQQLPPEQQIPSGQQPQGTGEHAREQDMQHHQQHLQQPAASTAAVGVAAGGLGRWEEFSGVALQERLVRLKEAFAQEECRKLLNDAVGL